MKKLLVLAALTVGLALVLPQLQTPYIPPMLQVSHLVLSGFKAYYHIRPNDPAMDLPSFRNMMIYLQSIDEKAKPGAPDVAVSDQHVAASNIPVRIYTPPGPGPFPIVLWFHGGGWSIGNHTLHADPLSFIALEAQAVVISVRYSLAPEARFPQALTELMEASTYIAKNARRFHGIPGQLALLGESAGATLATVLSHQARDSQAFTLQGVILVEPGTDLRDSAEAKYKSRTVHTNGWFLDRNMLEAFRGTYIRSGADPTDPRVSPILGNLEGLPRAFTLLGEYDMLKDEGMAYARELKAAGVHSTWKVYKGAVHPLITHGTAVPFAREAVTDIVTELVDMFTEPVKK